MSAPPDPSAHIAARAKELGISVEAVELYSGSEMFDLHVESFIWTRLFGYRLDKRHGRGLFGGHFYSQLDFPRVLEAQIAGAQWSIATNPLGSRRRLSRALLKNVATLDRLFATEPGFQRVQTLSEYRRARERGQHAAFLAVQGGNAFGDECSHPLLQSGRIIRVTLLHLTTSFLGSSSAPVSGFFGDGLTHEGHELVELLNSTRTFVDLAHISPKGFFDVVKTHDPTQPLVVTHTGVNGVFPSWRNLSDEQIRAVADTGGTVGIMACSDFLRKRGARACHVVDHIAHVIQVAGEDHVCLGSDFDGLIRTPSDLRNCLDWPRLVQVMLDRGFSTDRIQKLLGANFLRSLAQLRP